MKKFKVTCRIANEEMLNGTEPYDDVRYDFGNDYFMADTEEEIIPIALDWAKDMSDMYDTKCEIDANEITTIMNGIRTLYFDFKTEEM